MPNKKTKIEIEFGDGSTKEVILPYFYIANKNGTLDAPDGKIPIEDIDGEINFNIDSILDQNSENPLQNKIIYSELEKIKSSIETLKSNLTTEINSLIQRVTSLENNQNTPTESGSNIITGTTPPDNSVGKNGDIYIMYAE